MLGNWNKTTERSTSTTSDRKRKKAACHRHREKLLKAVSEPIATPSPTLQYRLALAGVLLGMLLVPLIYVTGTLLAVWWLLMHYAVHAHLVLEGIVPALCYLLPAFFGPFILFFLLKPFFAKAAAGTHPRKLERKDEPVLYDYVEQLCRSIGAPPPHEIRVNNEVNASASLANNNLFARRVTLTIGLPLVYGLTVEQLSGVLAHEFGHFAQKSGMRVSYLIRSISFWFLRALHTRDATHDWHDRYLSGRGLMTRIGRFFFLTGVFTARCILWVPMMFSNLISCLLIRQMEFDADRVEAALAGAKCFRVTHRRIVALTVAEQVAHSDLAEYYEEGRLVDDFARLVSASLDDISPKLRKAIDKQQQTQKTTWFDTHPSQSDRFENVESVGNGCTFVGEEKLRNSAATLLFDSINRVSRSVTCEFYRSVLGRTFKRGALYPSDDLLERKKAEVEADETLRRYFQVRMPPFYPIPIARDATEPSTKPKQTVAELIEMRELMVEYAAGYRRLLERYDHAENALMDAAANLSLHKVGVQAAAPVELEIEQKMSPEKLHRVVEEAVSHLALEMLEFEEAAGRRISATIRLIGNPKVAAKFKDGEQLRKQALLLVKHTITATDFMADLRTLRVLCHRVVVVMGAISDDVGDKFIDRLFSLLDLLQDRVKKLHWDMGSHEYPFDHGEGDKSLQEHVMPELPDLFDVSALLYVSRISFERLAVIQMRLFARLAGVAEAVESRIGLKALSLPPEPTEVKV